MTLYTVHLYREMRLTFERVEADTPEAAVAIAGERWTRDADDIQTRDGEIIAAEVDVEGDYYCLHSRLIEFEAERRRQAAPELLEAIPPLIGLVHRLLPKHAQSDSTLDNLPEVMRARAAIARATSIQPPTTERSDQ